MSREPMTARPCEGCAFGPTPDEGTHIEGQAAVERVQREIEAGGGPEHVLVRFTCHRARYLDNVRGALGYEPRYEGVQCHSACGIFDLDRPTTPVEPIDREFNALIERKCAQGPDGS